MNFKSQPLMLAPAFLNSIEALAAEPRERHAAHVKPPAGSRLVFEELIGVMEPEICLPLTSRLLRHANDDSVGGVALYIDSPGGLVASTPELAEAVRRVAAKKRIDVVAEHFLASAAMYAAAQATSITVSPSTLVGSCGVIHVIVDDSEFFKQLGIKVIAVTTGEFKSVGTPGVEVTPEQIAMIRRLADYTAAHFEAAISRGRKLTGKRLQAVMTGEVWYAAAAKHSGLVDEVALYSDAMATIIARYPAEKYFGLRGRAAYEQFMTLANAGVGEDDEAIDVDDIPAGTLAKIKSQYPALVAEALKFESTRYSQRTMPPRRF